MRMIKENKFLFQISFKLIYISSSKKDIIERFVIDDAVDEDSKGFHLKIEIRPLKVCLSCSYSNSTSNVSNRILTEEMSRQTTVEQITEKMKKLFKVPKDRGVRIYFKNDQSKLSLINNSNSDTLNSLGYGVDDVSSVEEFFFFFL